MAEQPVGTAGAPAPAANGDVDVAVALRAALQKLSRA
jgi:hypothetical protein